MVEQLPLKQTVGGSSPFRPIYTKFLFRIVVFEVFLYDIAYLNDLYRFIPFGILGGILLLSGYLYYSKQDTFLRLFASESSTAESSNNILPRTKTEKVNKKEETWRH